MFILEKPYISEFFIDTIIKNDWPVLDNTVIREANIEDGAFVLWDSKKAAEYYSQLEFPLIYSDSENAISWILDNLPDSNLSSYIKLFKDKILFRELLKQIYPNFYYRAVDYEMLQHIIPRDVRYPVVLKPAVGFLSFGVHTIHNDNEWYEALELLKKEMQIASSLYPDNVINSSNFIIEEMIEGEEYAIDAYYNQNGEAIILNIFQHPFLDEKDVSDRIYIMSKEIMTKYLEKFSGLLTQIGNLKNIHNFPMHIEVRVTKDRNVIPIEINPMRFAGWCTTDVAKYAWGINVYEYFYNQMKPDWNTILTNANDEIFYFSMAEVPSDIEKKKIKSFDYNKFLANYSNILELRKINYKDNPLFAVIFGSTKDKQEIRRILALKTKDYINC